jgi:prepilin-type processing-associated H-X9-DG protein
MSARVQSTAAFTLTDLLAIVAVLSLLVLTALAQPKSRVPQSSCANNLRQVGQAIQMFADENSDYLPPGAGKSSGLWVGQSYTYTSTSVSDLDYYLASYLGYPSPDAVTRQAKVFFCPGCERYNQTSGGNICFMVSNTGSGNVAGETPGLPWYPFGYPASSPLLAAAPRKISEITAFRSLSRVWTLVDVDKIALSQPLSWYFTLPSKPVHGNVRNYLFFDGHVAAQKVGAPGTY